MPPLTNPQNQPIGAVYGFTKMLLRLLQTHKPDLAVVAYDNHLPTLRKQKFPHYKGNRSKTSDIDLQFSVARSASKALGFLNIEAAGYEADDIIATLTGRATEAGYKVVIVSPDKDLMQLVSDTVTMYDSMNEKIITVEEVRKKFGVEPVQVRDVLALTGDIADNIQGVPRFGVTTAGRLIKEYGTLENLLRHIDEIPQKACRQSLENNCHVARQAYELVGLYTDAPIAADFEDMKVLYNRQQVRDFCELHDFQSIIRTFL
jgi:DNA polymerase-1